MVTTFCDADHAKSLIGRSITGWVLVLLGGTAAAAWSSHMQPHGVSLHTFEAEYFAICPAMVATRALQLVLADTGVKATAQVFNDNRHVVNKSKEGRIYGAKGLRRLMCG